MCISGFSGLINQVLWQRALKTVLGGGESLSTTIVIVVFMLGLGTGAYFFSKVCNLVKRPLRCFIILELILAVVNAIVWWVLSLDLSNSVFFVYEVAQSVGLSLQHAYGFISFAILIIPCFLMGITLPLAAHACEINLNIKRSNFLASIVGINTFGSVLGAFLSTTYLLPSFGISTSLVIAFVGNFLVAAILIVIAKKTIKDRTDFQQVQKKVLVYKIEKQWSYYLIGFILGAGSLAYELYLFRHFALIHTPLPTIFAFVVTGFLLFWSIGSTLCSFNRKFSVTKVAELLGLSFVSVILLVLPECYPKVLNLENKYIYPIFLRVWLVVFTLFIVNTCFSKFLKMPYGKILSILITLVITQIQYTAFTEKFSGYSVISFLYLLLVFSPFFLPCMFFGYLFGSIISQREKSWGDAVGKIYFFNTLGCVLSILVVYFVGSLVPNFYIFSTIVLTPLIVILLNSYGNTKDSIKSKFKQLTNSRQTYSIAFTIIICLGICLLLPIYSHTDRINSKHGVLEVTSDKKNLKWDGLWHSAFSYGGSHRDSNNWLLAMIPALSYDSHSEEDKIDVCVIGVATGITASTFAEMDSVKHVVGYDINPALSTLHKKYQSGTLDYIQNKKIETRWMDARAGLSIFQDKYDIIQTQPMYLKQAGSSLLNSVEFFKIVKSRLKTDGIFCLYSNGTPQQAFVVRETANKVFKYKETFLQGYMIILSDSPIKISEDAIRSRILADRGLQNELTLAKKYNSVKSIVKAWDSQGLPNGKGDIFVTDDYPIIEYPKKLSKLLDGIKLISPKTK